MQLYSCSLLPVRKRTVYTVYPGVQLLYTGINKLRTQVLLRRTQARHRDGVHAGRQAHPGGNEAQHWIHHGSRDIFGYSFMKMRHPPSWERWLGEAAFFCEPSADGKILAWRESGHARAPYSAHPLLPWRRSSHRRGIAIDARQAHLARHPFCHSFQTRSTVFSARGACFVTVAHPEKNAPRMFRSTPAARLSRQKPP